MNEANRQIVQSFLGQVNDMTADDFRIVREACDDEYVTRKSARPLIKLSASDFSWIDKRTREVAGSLLKRLTWENSNFPSMVVPDVLQAAQAIVCRTRLSYEQYEAFVVGFRAVGVVAPEWRDT